ncbi:unnamed protein product, partial [marine sediment metagenome]
AERAKIEYENALHLFPANESGWSPKVLTCSSENNTGINQIWDTIIDYKKYTKANKYFQKKGRNNLNIGYMKQ